MTPKTQQERSEAQEWASKIQDLEATIFRLQDELEVATHQLRIELTAAYSLIDSLQTENTRVRRDYQQMLSETIKTCNDLLQEIKK